MILETSVTKDNDIEKYIIRVKNLGWAIICLCTNIVFIHSDYGSWSYGWYNRGEGVSLKQFLLRSREDQSYIMGKFVGAEREIDSKATMQSLKRVLIEKIRNQTINKHEARSIIKSFDEIGHTKRESDYYHAYNEEDLISKAFPDGDLYFTVLDYPNSIRMFMKNIWGVFLDELERELN